MFCPQCGNEVLDGSRCPACGSPLVTTRPELAMIILRADYGEPAMFEEDDGRREDWAVWPEDFDRCP